MAVTIPKMFNPIFKNVSSVERMFYRKENFKPRLQRGSKMMQGRENIGEEVSKADIRKREWPVCLLGVGSLKISLCIYFY